MKKQSNKNGYAKVLKDKVDQIALECGFYKESKQKMIKDIYENPLNYV